MEGRKWLPAIIHLYLPVVDSETGDFRHLPFPGALSDQPHVTMELLRVIQAAFKAEIQKRVKEGR